jgi:RNA polymerase sigma-70 factor (ECF subfamily)
VTARLYQDGRRAWPDVALAAEVFAAHLAALHPGGAPDDLSSDLYLACACAGGDPAAIAALDRDFLATLDPALGRLGDDAFIAEVKQTLREKLLVAPAGGRPRIADYAGTGNLRGWLKVAAVRTAISLRRREHPAEPLDGPLDVAAPDADPELRFLQEKYRAEFRAAFTEAAARLSSRDRNVLRYQALDGLSIDEIGALYGVHRATAARWIGRARELLVAGTRKALQARLGVDRDELDSVMRLIESRLDLSLRSLMRTR